MSLPLSAPFQPAGALFNNLEQDQASGKMRITGRVQKPRVALVCREGETAAALLERLDAELGKAMAADTVVDEVLPEIKRRRTR